MTQQEAIYKLEEILGRELRGYGYDKCTGRTLTCPIDECMLCSVRDCPGDEPLHYHHDGCPYCYQTTYFWGTPLEDLSIRMLRAVACGEAELAYIAARGLYQGFMRINPSFWE